MGIDNFFGTKKINRQKTIEDFRKETKSNETQREFERTYLKPNSLPDYTGPQPISTDVDKLRVLITFHSKDELTRFERFCKINRYIQTNLTDNGIIMAFIAELEKGTLKYDPEEKRLHYTIQRNR